MDFMAKWPNCVFFVNSKKLDIVCITESHFSDKLEDVKIQILGFNIFMGTKKSVDANDKGGSVIYIRDNISVVDRSYDQGIDSTYRHR